MRLQAALLLSWLVGLMTPATLQAAGAPGPMPLLPEEQAAIARAFAPVFIFHPEEQYFPISSTFPLTLGNSSTKDVADSSPREQLGSAAERAARYTALPNETKLALAAVGYRVFPRFKHGETEVVVEYWCHYVYNAFTIRGTWLPYRISGNHPQDLERLFLVLTPVPGVPADDEAADEEWARRAFRIRRIVANAHDGSVPANEFEVKDQSRLDPPVSILVERGSHAMAPDINHDGRFTPKVDSTTTNKLLWGIRDGGSTWGWYRKGQMDVRDPERAVRLCAARPSADASPDDCAAYRLYPIENLQRWFDALNLSARERHEVVGSTSLFTRTFSNVRVEELMVPKDLPDGRLLDRMVRRRPRSGQGLLAGFASLSDGPGLAVGPRFFGDVRSRRWPDVVAEAVALFPQGQRPVAKTSVFGSYTVDAMTSVVLGADWISGPHPSADIVTGIEFHIGMMLVRPSWRLREGVFDSLVVAVF
jgi:hypothetical protein